MADENIQDAAAAPAPTEVAPTEVAQVDAEAVVADTAPEGADAAAEVVTAPEGAPEEPAAPEAEATLLEKTTSPGTEEAEVKAEPAPKAEEEKPAEDAAPKEPEKKDAAAEKKDAAAEEANPALDPVEYKYELPETLKMDDQIKEATHAALDAFRADPQNPQPLIDLHHEMMQKHDAAVRQQQWDVFNETRKDWRSQVMADPEIGGAGHHTAMQAIARMRDRFASSERPGTKAYDADLQAFDGMLRATGVGDHPIFLKALHRVAQLYDEPPMGPTNVTPAPVKAGAKVLYDNPRSAVKQ